MAYVTCAISGVLFEVSHFSSLRLPASEGFPHPIFAANMRYLQSLYIQHTKGNLTATDSYLLFMAYLHSSNKIEWQHPSVLSPNDDKTIKMVENNLAQLIKVLEKSANIFHPRFKQPSFKVTEGNCNLIQIPNWIKAWEQNITDFYMGRASDEERDAIIKIENKFTTLILSGEQPHKYASTIADWADKAAEFPKDKSALYKETIRNCFNKVKMFNTPLPLLKDIKAFCEENIELGSIHYSALMDTLNEGIYQHINYLGGTSLALGYTILPTLDSLGAPDGKLVPLHSKQAAEIAETRTKVKASEEQLKTIILNAPLTPPQRAEYTNPTDFIRAKLAYRTARNAEDDLRKLNQQLEGL